ncbi:MAG TPA: TRAP transporter substrate-binding protein DctP [Polyangia bacterium]|jgi:TRAP-type C4-dicarboxylate transport system substrate-binding protein|nr:TRAP transporter substrate-binding protein DctP [Polyangia bacterium]
MKKTAFLLFALLCSVAAPARADVIIKLGTLAPNGSTWHTLLKEMGQKWEQASGGKVKLRIYPGGVLGNEGDMVKKMRIGQLQAAALTTIGLHDIDADAQAIDVPMMIDSWTTLDYVMDRMAPKLERIIEGKGYVVLGWSEVGFVRFFSTKKYASLPEMQNAKMFCWEGDPASAEAWRAGGFHPVVMSSTDIVPGLQTGLIDTVALAPLYAYSSRMFEKAKYMLDLPWAVLTGGTVVRKDEWDKVPADIKPKLIEISREYSKKVALEVRRMDAEALENMAKQGLVVVKPTDPADFAKAAQKAYSVVRGKVVPAETFDEVRKLVEEAKAQSAKK